MHVDSQIPSIPVAMLLSISGDTKRLTEQLRLGILTNSTRWGSRLHASITLPKPSKGNEASEYI